MSLLCSKPFSDTLINRVNIYKALHYLAFHYLSDLISFHASLCFLAFCHIGLLAFSPNWPGFLPPLPFSTGILFPQRAILPFGVYSQVPFSGGLPGPFPTCPYCLTFVYDIFYFLFFVYIPLICVYLYMEYIKLTMEGIFASYVHY